MIFYYIKTALKNLWNNKKYSLINILGFSFSISIALIIILFVMHETSYDKYHTNYKQIYRLIDDEHNRSDIDYRVKDILLDNFADLSNACLYQQVSFDIPVTCNNEGYYINHIASIDKEFFNMFDTHIIKGNKDHLLVNLNSAILTQSCAKKLFGDKDPLGTEIILLGNMQVIVTGVIENFPENSSIQADMLVNAENDDFKFSKYIGNSDDLSTYKWPFEIFIQLSENSNSNIFLSELNNNLELISPYVDKAGLIPLKDIYLNDTTFGSRTKRGNPALLKLLTAIAFIVLSLAVINYINLTLAQQNRRGKEIGLRKTIGASRNDIIIQFLFESIIVTLLAFGFSLLLFELLFPFTLRIFNVRLTLLTLFQFPINLIFPISLITLGIIIGIWPALIFSLYNPIRILSKRLVNMSRKDYSRNVLTVFQFTVSIILIICVIVIWKQIEYSKNSDLGFNKDQLLKIDLPLMTESSSQRAMTMVNALRDYSSISSLTLSNGVPGFINTYMGSGIEGKDQNLAILVVDSTFLKTFDIKILRGRDFLPGDFEKVCLINKAAMEYFEWADLHNKRYNNGREGGFEVVGVVEDFHVGSFHSSIEPMAILFHSWPPSNISLKISGENIGTTLNYIQKVWKELLSEYPMKYQFYDDWFNSMYEKEEQFGRIISFFAILAISISCIGILGLAIFTSERRTKEIGIRKVNGASIENILILLSKEFTIWVLIAFIIGSPIAFIFVNKWLQNFAYRTDISWWIYIVSGFSALLIAWLTVCWQTIKMALINPVDVLRYE